MARLALLIGVSEYEPGLNPLPAAVKDLDAIKEVLLHPDMGGFAKSAIVMLKNPNRQEMEESIETLFANRHKDDLVVLFFSGHSIKDDEGTLYLGASKTRKTPQGDLVRSSAVAATFVHGNMSRSRSKRQVVILDSCFSGAFAEGLTAKDDGIVDIKTQLGGEGRAVLTSSSSTQYSFEQDGQELSLYTRFLVEGINTGAADLDGDDVISIDELHEYVSRKVREVKPELKPEIYAVREGYKIRLSNVPQGDPRQKYRKEVARCGKRGKLTIISRSILDTWRIKLGLSVDEAKVLEYEVLEPYRQEFQQKLQQYKRVFFDSIQFESPISEATRKELQRLQQLLSLSDEEVAEIESRLSWDKQTEDEEQTEKVRQKQESAQLRETKTTTVPLLEQRQTEPIVKPAPSNSVSPRDAELAIKRRQLLKWGGFGGGGLVVALIGNEIFQRQQLQTVSVAKPKITASGTAKVNGLPLWTVEFETVLVDEHGKVTQRPSHQAKFIKEALGNGIELELVSLAAGSFQMGAHSAEAESSDDERPQHPVTLKSFLMSKYPITQAQWKAVAALSKIKIALNSDPSSFKGNNLPVETVSWYEAVEFCARLSQKTGKNYRLPSEAEWEYACRAGTKTPFYFGETISPELANYDSRTAYGQAPTGAYRGKTTEVGSFKVANAYGLYDMHGNVWEWCQDLWHERYKGSPTDGSAWIIGGDASYRVLRGGSWAFSSRWCRSSYRYDVTPATRAYSIGFRVVCGYPRTL